MVSVALIVHHLVLYANCCHYYPMKNRLTRQFDKAVYAWDDVSCAQSFDSSLAYNVVNRTFAYLLLGEADFLLLCRITPEERAELTERFGAGPDTRYKPESRLFWCIPLSEVNLPELLPYVRLCYERVVQGLSV
jgi:hypothetical protein